MDLGKLEGVMLAKEQIPTETYRVNDKVKGYVINVEKGGDTMIKTYNELYKFVKESDNFGKDVLDILFELDETGSIVTQASLNDILVSIYNRLDKCKIRIEGLGEKVSKSEFAQWVEDKFDTYTANLFKDSI